MKANLRVKIQDVLELAYAEDLDLNNALAEYFLDGMDYYIYCKECAEDMLESVYDTLEEDFLDHLEKFPEEELNARELTKKIYKININ